MSIFQKELKQLVHDKGALLSTLLLPFVSTMILGFALTNSFSSEVSFEDVSIVVIETSTLEEDLQIASERFSVHKDELKPLAVPDSLFAYMDGDISVDYYSPDSNVVHEDYTAVIEIPSEYRLMLWHEQLVGGWSEQVESFQLYVNQEQRQHAMMVETMMNSYMEQVYAHTELAENDEGIIDFGNVVVQGTSPLTSFEYYTYGMGVLYVFFTAGLMANFAFSEKKRKNLWATSHSKCSTCKLFTGEICDFMRNCLSSIIGFVLSIYADFSNYNHKLAKLYGCCYCALFSSRKCCLTPCCNPVSSKYRKSSERFYASCCVYFRVFRWEFFFRHLTYHHYLMKSDSLHQMDGRFKRSSKPVKVNRLHNFRTHFFTCPSFHLCCLSLRGLCFHLKEA